MFDLKFRQFSLSPFEDSEACTAPRAMLSSKWDHLFLKVMFH